jgi:choline dehydrogenase-like flavoprotein
MGRDPADGVVDADCRVFGVDNLYVAGSAVFPTSGQANPTLTIVALAVRLAQHIEAKASRPAEILSRPFAFASARSHGRSLQPASLGETMRERRA